jgi:hypothetical protein
MRLRTTALIGVVMLALAAPMGALAAQTYSDMISGHEYYYTSTDGKFAGTASGALPGDWNADVQHTKLCLSCTPTATITDGSFSLATTLGGIPTLVTGTFTGGTVQVINQGTDCTNQTFAVNGILGSVASGTAATAMASSPPPSPTTAPRSWGNASLTALPCKGPWALASRRPQDERQTVDAGSVAQARGVGLPECRTDGPDRAADLDPRGTRPHIAGSARTETRSRSRS